MGYMGFGMKKDLYTKSSKKPFKNSRLQQDQKINIYTDNHDVDQSKISSHDQLFLSRERNFRKIRKIILLTIGMIVLGYILYNSLFK